MTRQIDLEDFILAGHATTVECTGTTEPITLSGYYRQTNSDFFYYVSWDNGRMDICPIGYSAEYLAAEREYTRRHGAVLDDASDARKQQFIAQQLGIPTEP